MLSALMELRNIESYRFKQANIHKYFISQRLIRKRNQYQIHQQRDFNKETTLKSVGRPKKVENMLSEKKPDTKGYISYNSFYMIYLQQANPQRQRAD